jgi:diacylglycerol kinase (ATP)
MDKAILIYNPKSGHRSVPEQLDYIIKRFLDNDVLLQPYRINSDNCEERLVSILTTGNYKYAVVSGGDGTVSSIANIILKNNMDMAVGIIPSGTCNDFARSLNISVDLKQCLDTILNGNMTEIDVGLINDKHYFLNTCAGGIFVDVSFSTSSELKRNLGPLAYYIKALGEVANIKPVRLKVTTDTEMVEDDFFLFLILNGKHAGGFSNIIKHADISDGIMDILLIKNCMHIDLAALFFKVLRNEYLNDKNVMWLKTRRCSIDGSGDVAISIDGEKGMGLPISVNFVNKALKVFV